MCKLQGFKKNEFQNMRFEDTIVQLLMNLVQGFKMFYKSWAWCGKTQNKKNYFCRVG